MLQPSHSLGNSNDFERQFHELNVAMDLGATPISHSKADWFAVLANSILKVVCYSVRVAKAFFHML